ncbi:hypothetical protein CLIM01_03456 [Colletotrichum limetticola]|uniref:Uncharacterized protein n=1 Tax=Colletotrichum limetticola TaxID=1209924 RepID=A0ABQ9Q678_9PEZI|nr:hypothetical protein CLIM01_03456 [Colletotrichum limetticola]
MLPNASRLDDMPLGSFLCVLPRDPRLPDDAEGCNTTEAAMGGGGPTNMAFGFNLETEPAGPNGSSSHGSTGEGERPFDILMGSGGDSDSSDTSGLGDRSSRS